MRVVDESGFTRYRESPLDKINNVEYDQPIWGRILGYGNVDIQTAAEMGETKYTHSSPQIIKRHYYTCAGKNTKDTDKQPGSTTGAGHYKNSPAASQQMVADELHKLFELLQKVPLQE